MNQLPRSTQDNTGDEDENKNNNDNDCLEIEVNLYLS